MGAGLFGERSDELALGDHGACQERMTGSEQFGRANVLRFNRPERRRGVHDGGVTLAGLERTVDPPFTGHLLFVDLETAYEAVASAEVCVRNLMAHRARHAILSEPIAQLL